MRTIGASIHFRCRGGGLGGTGAVGVNIGCPVGLLALAEGGRMVEESFADETIAIVLTLLVKDMAPLIVISVI